MSRSNPVHLWRFGHTSVKDTVNLPKKNDFGAKRLFFWPKIKFLGNFTVSLTLSCDQTFRDGLDLTCSVGKSEPMSTVALYSWDGAHAWDHLKESAETILTLSIEHLRAAQNSVSICGVSKDIFCKNFSACSVYIYIVSVVKNYHQKLSSKIVIRNCHQKLSSKIVMKNWHQKL